MNGNTLVDTLRERQAREGWSYRDVGRELGLDHMIWYRISRGQQEMTLQFLRHLLARFPEYLPQAFLFLQSGAPNGSGSATHGETAA